MNDNREEGLSTNMIEEACTYMMNRYSTALENLASGEPTKNTPELDETNTYE